MAEPNEKLGGFPFVIGGLSFIPLLCVDLGTHDEKNRWQKACSARWCWDSGHSRPLWQPILFWICQTRWYL